MEPCVKIFGTNFHSRERVVAFTSGFGAVVNLFVALLRIVVGTIASSMAVISEGINSATDSLISIVAFVGAKLATKRPDQKHPFGYGRIEYLTSLAVGVFILVAGIETLVNSVKLIFKPSELNLSALALIVVVVSSAVKFALGVFMIRIGRKVDSGALTAVGLDSRNDSFFSVATVGSIVLFWTTGVSIDAYVGVLAALLLLKTGFDVLRGAIDELLGGSGKKELADAIYKEIRETEGIIAAADLTLHNYGSDRRSGSVNLEMDYAQTVGEIYQIIHQLQLRIMREYRTTLVFGVYAVDRDGKEVAQLRKTIEAFAAQNEHIKSFHALYLDPKTQKIYCDFVVDYDLKDWAALRDDFLRHMRERYPNNEVALTIETEFV